MNEFYEIRNKYNEFIYNSFSILEEDEKYILKYEFIIPNLCNFHPEIKINKSIIKNNNIDKNLLNYIIFHIGLIESISYYKAVCSPNFKINCGYLDVDQINWFKKIIFNGLGELLYKYNVNIKEDEFVNINALNGEKPIFSAEYHGSGNLIAVGGGKDSCVSLEILKNEENNSCFIINPKEPSTLCAKTAGYDEENIITIERILDKKIIELNEAGFINGHTPFSAIVAFTSYLCAYLSGKKQIVLSNESSANEPTVLGSNVNHQYSKSFEFENDFNNYVNKYFNIDIKYFSLLRGLSEYQIGMLFSKYKKYHNIFKSCNVGSKQTPWKWCCNCSKCLFVYIILSPHLYKEELIDIFGEDLFEKESLLPIFKDTIGETGVKPFECVGTINEAKFAISTLINKLDKNNLPFLLKYYLENNELYLDENNILTYNENNNIDDYYNRLVKAELNND